MKWWDRTDQSMSLAYSENYRLFLFHCSVVFECSERSSKRRAETQVCIWEGNSSSQKSQGDIHKIINNTAVSTILRNQGKWKFDVSLNPNPSSKSTLGEFNYTSKRPDVEVFFSEKVQTIKWSCGHKKQHLRISGIFIINVQVGRNNTFQK